MIGKWLLLSISSRITVKVSNISLSLEKLWENLPDVVGVEQKLKKKENMGIFYNIALKKKYLVRFNRYTFGLAPKECWQK